MTLAAVCTAIALMAIITPAGTSHEEEPEPGRYGVQSFLWLTLPSEHKILWLTDSMAGNFGNIQKSRRKLQKSLAIFRH